MADTKKLSREELEAKVAEADALAEMKSNFLATMSHEIRTPMQSIFGLLELIGDEKPSEKVAEMVETAQGAAAGLLEILDDVLDLAKMDADKMELDDFEVPVRLLVRGLLEALSVKVHGVNIAIEDDIEEDVPFVVRGDPKRLRQVIMNLCSNALKFTHTGSVCVRVTRDVQHIDAPADGVALRFEVVDTGIGMGQEVCERLFQSFTQADNSTSRKYGGTGLGLSICKKLVELMDGVIGVDSVEGEGSTFWFEIPTQEVSTDGSSVELPNLDGISVLSVEDHPFGAKEIVNSLQSMGALVESCPTYAEGLALIKARPFDVAVIDQGLPDGLGLDLIKEIRGIRPETGLVMYTVRDDIGLAHSLKAQGAAFLTKPASRAGLGEAVKDATDRIEAKEIKGPRRLLIAEDTASVQDILKRQLEKIGGVEADFVWNGREALEALNTGQYGILITDLHMPEIDGYELVQQLRMKETLDHTSRFPIVVLTADVQMAQREVFMEHGFDECLLKPVSLGQFERLLMRWGILEKKDTEKHHKEPKAETAQSHIDKDAMIAIMGAFDDGAIEMLGMFVEMTQSAVDALPEILASGDMKALSEAGHSLKGGARSACCPALGDLAAQLQDDAADGKDCDALVQDIIAEFEAVQAEIETLKA